MRGDTIGVNLRIAKNGFHCVSLDTDIADESNLRDMLGDFKVVVQLEVGCQWITDGELGSE